MISTRLEANQRIGFRQESMYFPSSHAACRIHSSLPEMHLFSTNQRLDTSLSAEHTSPYMQSPTASEVKIPRVDGNV